MGSAVNKNNRFVFDEKKYIDIIKGSMKTNSINNNDDVLKSYRCKFKDHFETQIDFICTNVTCNSFCRMVCKLCVRDDFHLRDV